MKPKSMSSTSSKEKCPMYSISDSSTVITGNDTEEIIQELFDSLLRKNQTGLQQSELRTLFLIIVRAIITTIVQIMITA